MTPQFNLIYMSRECDITTSILLIQPPVVVIIGWSSASKSVDWSCMYLQLHHPSYFAGDSNVMKGAYWTSDSMSASTPCRHGLVAAGVGETRHHDDHCSGFQVRAVHVVSVTPSPRAYPAVAGILLLTSSLSLRSRKEP